jgi:hypothetical protein
MIADSDRYGYPYLLDTTLTTPEFDCSEYTKVYLDFAEYYQGYSNGYGAVDVWDGTDWVNFANYTTSNVFGPTTLDISSAAAGHDDVKIRWHYYVVYAWYWEVDNVMVWGAAEPIFSDEVTIDGLPSGEKTTVEFSTWEVSDEGLYSIHVDKLSNWYCWNWKLCSECYDSQLWNY